jgi:periplasmic protein TonB
MEFSSKTIMWGRVTFVGIASLTLAACGKDEATKTASAGSSASKASSAPFVVPTEAPTERARQRIEREAAAAKLLEAPAKAEPKREREVAPAAPTAPAPAPVIATPAPTPAPVAAPAAPAPVPVAAVASPPPTQVALAPAAAPRPEPTREVPKAEPPRTVAPSTSTRVISREEPSFPREAIQGGIREGRVTARMAIDAAGNVTRVDIVSAEPRNIFNRSVQRALQRWKFEPGAEGRSAETEIVFRE